MSWAEDMGHDAYDESDIHAPTSDTQEYGWEDKGHRIRLIHDMDTPHIKNILAAFEKHKSTKNMFYGQSWKIPYFEKELEKRMPPPGSDAF